MRRFFIVTILLSSFGCSNGQSPSEVDYSKGICECLDSLSKTGDVQTNFPACFQRSLDTHYQAAMLEVKKKYGDPTVENITKLMEELQLNVSIELINSCTAFFKFSDSLKHQQYKNLNKDSLRNLLTQLEKADTVRKTEKNYEYASTLCFQLGLYDKALQNVEKILSQDSINVTALFIKASIMDLNKNYQDAIILYDKVAKLSHQNGFYIYSAIARRKQNGL